MNFSDIDYMEVNEAFSIIPLAFAKKINIDIDNMNVYGGQYLLGIRWELLEQ